MQAVGKISKIFTMQIIRRNIYGATHGRDFPPYRVQEQNNKKNGLNVNTK